MKNLYFLPLLSLLGLAGCSNSPAPEPYTPPPAPQIIAEPTPVPESGGVINTDAFIAQGDQLVARERLVTKVPVTRLDNLIYEKTRRPSMSVITRSLLNEVDASNTSLADNLLIIKSDIIKRITGAIAGIIAADPRLSRLDPNMKASVSSIDSLQSAVLNYAETKYRLTTKTIDRTTGLKNMAAYRSIALRNAIAVDNYTYRTVTTYERMGVNFRMPAATTETTTTTTTTDSAAPQVPPAP